MKRVIFLQIVILNIIFFASCVKDKHYLFVEEYDDLNPNKSQDDLAEKTYTFNFNAKINPLISISDNTLSKTVYTPDTTAVAQGRIIHIYIYKDDVTPQTGTYSQMLIYEVYTNGFIKPVSDQYKINLTAGIYSFYAISENNNSSDKTPGFVNSNGTGGEMQGMSNGCEFIWWNNEKVKLGDEYLGENIEIFNNHGV